MSLYLTAAIGFIVGFALQQAYAHKMPHPGAIWLDDVYRMDLKVESGDSPATVMVDALYADDTWREVRRVEAAEHASVTLVIQCEDEWRAARLRGQGGLQARIQVYCRSTPV